MLNCPTLKLCQLHYHHSNEYIPNSKIWLWGAFNGDLMIRTIKGCQSVVNGMDVIVPSKSWFLNELLVLSDTSFTIGKGSLSYLPLLSFEQNRCEIWNHSTRGYIISRSWSDGICSWYGGSNAMSWWIGLVMSKQKTAGSCLALANRLFNIPISSDHFLIVILFSFSTLHGTVVPSLVHSSNSKQSLLKLACHVPVLGWAQCYILFCPSI